MIKMETRIRELESELNAENRRFTDSQKNLRKTERHVKELTFTQDEDKKNHERMQGMIDNLQAKIKSYKKQIEEAEEIAALEKILLDCEEYSTEELDKVIADLKIKDPDTGNDLSPAMPFNLMFQMQIGPSGYMQGYLRPETAQGIFINFRRLIEFNNGRMPFAAA